MELVELKKLCSMKSGGTPSRRKSEFYEGDFPWAKISDLEKSADGYVYDTVEKITDEALNSINNRVFEKGTLLLAMYGSVGKTAIAGIKLTTNQAILGLNILDDKTLDIFYLKYWFQLTKESLLNRAVGGTLQNISKTIVSNLKIPLQPLPTQKKIAAILDQADKLRQLNKQLIAKYDALTQSLFLEMFGDIRKNEKSFKEEKIEEACSLVTDGAHRTPKILAKGYPFLTVANMGEIGYKYEKCKRISEEEYLSLVKNNCQPLVDDILFSKDGTVGKVMRIRRFEEVVILSSIALLRFKEYYNPIFVEYYLKSDFFLFQAISRKSGSAIRRIVLKDLKKTKLANPPIKLQDQFAERVQIIENQKQQAQNALQKSEDLFNSLLQKAFKGELVK